jgi:hypothetical protein
MRFGGVQLSAAASGRAWLTTPSTRRFLWLCLLLRHRYGFVRRGGFVGGAGEAIHPDFVRGALCLHAGEDDWVGFHLLAANAASDRFLRELFATHCTPCPGGA